MPDRLSRVDTSVANDIVLSGLLEVFTMLDGCDIPVLSKGNEAARPHSIQSHFTVFAYSVLRDGPRTVENPHG